MTATTPFVASLRARPDTIAMSPAGNGALTLRVQLAEAWDMVRVTAAPADTIAAVKLRALEALDQSADAPGEYAVSYLGVRLLAENESLSGAGIVNGATLFIARRHRRPVR